MKRTHFKKFFGVLAFLFLLSCGDLTPWGSLETPLYTNLTQKNLDLLRTGSDTFKPFKVALVADPQVLPGELKECRTAINQRNDIDFSLLLGDLTDRSLRKEFEWVAKILSEFRRPILTVVGNHDGLIYGDEIYRKMFGPLDYSFIYNDVKFIMWNNNTYEWGYPKFDWLQSEIESHPRVIIVAHQPPGVLERYDGINERFNEVFKHPHVLGSVHGHLHNWGYQEVAGKPVLIVERVEGSSWGILNVTETGISFEQCKGSTCKSIP